MMAIPMGKSLGQSVVVENVNGAGGTVGATKVARSAPNGYTIFLHHMGMSTSPALYKKLNNLPTLDEQGLKGFEVKVWHGMYAPKGTPAPVLTQINTAMRAAMAEPSIVQRLGELSSEIPSADKMTAKGLEDHLKAEISKWGPVIRKAGVSAD